ncbi:NAD(P)H-binding protein [Arthrobacter sp. efr-133-TYG-104]|uniref:NAD(P)H-binding protein n=1 Tax=Arthrobacter sp. efr-133-TYG-104 TaxID=3040324 RepID=UPI00254ABB05|nr:NAD(P)H-binding protein [Arthrobacter sp. efr-133-TYG-104]
MSRIAIIGGHGKVALHLSRILSDEGHDVTSFVRNPDHVPDITETGASAQVLDVENATTAELAQALKDHDAVVWSAGAGGGNPDRTYAVDRDAAIRSMDAAAEAGVARYVMVSYIGSAKDHGVPPSHPFFAYAQAKAAADDYLRGTGLDWTVLGPGALTDEPATGLIERNPDNSGEDTHTSRANVALVVAAVLELPETIHQTITFTDGSDDVVDALTAA